MIVGLLFTCVAVVGIAAKFRDAGDRVAVLVVAREVAEGTAIKDEDLRQALVAPDVRLKTVAAGERSRFVGKIAAVDLLPGTNITEGSITEDPAVGIGQVLIGVALRDGRFPAGLRIGDDVRLLGVPASADETGTSVVAKRAIVRSIGKHDEGLGLTDIELVVDAKEDPSTGRSEYEMVAAAAAHDELVIVRLGPQT